MRKFIIAAMLLVCGNVYSQSNGYIKEGNVFKFESSKNGSSRTKDTLVTKYEWEDSKGTKYPIIINRQSGRCYIYKKSSKTGKIYKQYMKTEISQAICKELKVEFKEN